MRLASAQDLAVAAAGAFELTFDLEVDGFLNAIAIDASVASDLETRITSIRVGKTELLPIAAGNGVPWSVFITANGTQWFRLAKALAVKGGATLTITGTNQNGGASDFFGLASYGKN